MPSCWVINPIVNIDGVNRPKIATLSFGDPPRSYAYSSVIYPERGKTWCLSFVTGPSFAAIDDDPECERVFADEEVPHALDVVARKQVHAQWLQERPRRPRAQLVGLATQQGIDVSDMTDEATRRDWVQRLGMGASGDADFRPEGWFA